MADAGVVPDKKAAVRQLSDHLFKGQIGEYGATRRHGVVPSRELGFAEKDRGGRVELSDERKPLGHGPVFLS